MAGRNILIVDDEKDLTAALGSFLKTKGHAISMAHSGKAALEVFKKQRIDLLLLDLNMPGINGAEVAGVVKEHYAGTKILLLTAYSEEYRDKLTLVRVEGIITKPFGVLTLLDRIQKLLGEETASGPIAKAKDSPRPVRALFIDPATSYILKDYALPYIRLSWGGNIEVESVSPAPASAVREKIIFFKPDIVLLSTVLCKQAEQLSDDISMNVYRPKEIVIYNVPDEKFTEKSSAAAYYSMQKSLMDINYLSRLNELIKETALKHNLIEKGAFRIEKPSRLELPPGEFTIKDIAGFVKEAISKELDLKEVELEDKTSFVDDLGVDSLETIELTMALEDTFGLELPDEDIAGLRTVGEAIEYIKKRADLEKLARKKRPKRKILIIDDQEGMCSFLVNYFLAKGYDAVCATESEAAMAILGKEKPDVALLDIKMPGTDGITLLKRIKELEPSTKVIMVSVALERENEARRCGADAFISKPFPITYLEKTVIEKIKELVG